MQIPALPSGLTADYLTGLLHETRALPAASHIGEVTQEPLTDSTGMMAALCRLRLRVDGDAGRVPPTLVAKFSSPVPANRAIAEQYHLAERETRFMAELAPRLDLRTPRACFAAREDDRFLILMEDLSDYAVGDQVTGAGLEQSGHAMDQLAKLHGAFWDRTEALDWVPHVAESYHGESMRAVAAPGIDAIGRKFGDCGADALLDRRDAFVATLPALQARLGEPPLTLCHGDFRLANLLFGGGEDPVVVLDWQAPQRICGLYDVALFLAQSTRSDVRRAHESTLLERYRSGLAAAGATGLDRFDLMAHYRLAVLYSWCYVAAVALLDDTNEASEAWRRQMVSRQALAAEDLEVYDLLDSLSKEH